MSSAAIAALTDRDRQILNLLGAGFADEEIAEPLGISRSAVKGHLRRIARRNGFGRLNRLQIASEFCERPTPPLPSTFTARQRLIAKCIAFGMRDREIATFLELPLGTISKDVTEMLDASGCWSRLEMIVRFDCLKDPDSMADDRRNNPDARNR